MIAHDFYSRDKSIFGIVINRCDFIFVLNGLFIFEIQTQKLVNRCDGDVFVTCDVFLAL